MINGPNVYDQSVKNNIRAYNNILKIKTGQGDDYATGCLLFYPYFIENCTMMAIDSSKQQILYANPKEIPQINLNQFCCKSGLGRTQISVFHYWRSKRNHFKLFTRYSESIVDLLYFSIILI